MARRGALERSFLDAGSGSRFGHESITVGYVNPLVVLGFALIVLGVVGSFVVDSRGGYAVMIIGWLLLMIDWQRQRGLPRSQ